MSQVYTINSSDGSIPITDSRQKNRSRELIIPIIIDIEYRFRFVVREMTIASIAVGSTAAIAIYIFYACNKRCQGDRNLILPAAA